MGGFRAGIRLARDRLVLWARIHGATQNPMFNLKIVRAG